jgi:hypothetical protein
MTMADHTIHGPDATVDRRLATEYTYDPRLEPLAILQRDAPDAFALLPDRLRQSVGPYVRRWNAAQGAGLQVGPPTNGADALNRDIRRKAGRLPPEPAQDDNRAVETTVSTGADDDGRDAVLAAATAARFAHPDIAWRLVRDDLEHDDRGRVTNAAAVVSTLAQSDPYLIAPPAPVGFVGQGHRGNGAAIASNDAMNAWMREERQVRRDRRLADQADQDERVRRP